MVAFTKQIAARSFVYASKDTPERMAQRCHGTAICHGTAMPRQYCHGQRSPIHSADVMRQTQGRKIYSIYVKNVFKSRLEEIMEGFRYNKFRLVNYVPTKHSQGSSVSVMFWLTGWAAESAPLHTGVEIKDATKSALAWNIPRAIKWHLIHTVQPLSANESLAEFWEFAHVKWKISPKNTARLFG